MAQLTSGVASAISTGLGVAGTLAGTFSQVSASKAAAANAKQSAKIARDQASARAEQLRLDATRMRGSQRASIGGSGIRGDAFQDVINDSNYDAELDALTAEYEGTLQSNSYKAQAKQYKNQGKQALIGGLIGAGAQALGGYGAWKQQQEYSAVKGWEEDEPKYKLQGGGR